VPVLDPATYTSQRTLSFSQYGLGPIMKELGAKLERELPPGSYVLSNVFSVPGWEPVAASNASTTVGSSTYYIYQMPQRKSPPSTRRSG
jgi:hypothetical protein